MTELISRRHFLRKTAAAGAFSSVSFLGIGQDAAADRTLSPEELSTLPGRDADEEKYWKLIRMQFPLTRNRIYFNTSGLGASPRFVMNAVYEKMLELETISETGHEQVKEVTEKIARLFHVDPEEIAITRNTTEGMNIFAREVPLEKGDEVLLSTHEHPGGSIPWLAVMKDKGIKLKLFEPDYRRPDRMAEIVERNLTSRTRVVSIDHIPCTTGSLFPAGQIARLCRDSGIIFGIDGAHPPGQMPVNLREIDPDFYALSGHKWLFGPKGTGILFINKRILPRLRPCFVGAYSDREFRFEDLVLEYKMEANREEYGTRNTPLVCGLGAAVDFVSAIGVERIQKRGKKLAAFLKDELLKIPDVDVLTPLDPAQSASIVTFGIKGMAYGDIQKPLLDRFCCRTRGIFEHGLQAIRISCAVYNTFEEMEKLAAAVKIIASGG
jgi:selenocysteine lyase/cysteine desulfurase